MTAGGTLLDEKDGKLERGRLSIYFLDLEWAVMSYAKRTRTKCLTG